MPQWAGGEVQFKDTEGWGGKAEDGGGTSDFYLRHLPLQACGQEEDVSLKVSSSLTHRKSKRDKRQNKTTIENI